jgi:Cof subfamily protein (haloacid dehalogenase superfamily)
MYKLIVSDMDGTLLKSDRTVSEGVCKAIDDARKAGIMFTVSTGRPEVSTLKFKDIIGYDIPAILYNGAMIKDLNTMKRLFGKQIDFESVKQIISAAEENGVTCCIWSGGNIYVKEENDKTSMYRDYHGLQPKVYDDISIFNGEGVEKILWIDTPERNIEFMKRYNSNIPGVTCVTSQPIFLEFFNNNVSKAIATEKLCEIVGIKIDECVAVGDGLNDLDMIQCAGLGICMANGADAVKSHAGYVTSATNNEDGLAEAIYKVIELNKA